MRSLPSDDLISDCAPDEGGGVGVGRLNRTKCKWIYEERPEQITGYVDMIGCGRELGVWRGRDYISQSGTA